MAIQSLQPARRIVNINLNQQDEASLRSGKIKKIYLQNFMCHSNFEVNMNKCINIIVGLNGSGKSAILTAIAIGLGGKASSTARSTNLKDLVKRGEHSAVIEVTLANNGIDSYEHDVYGDEIIVVRTINGNSGASSYKLKNQHGRIVSTSRQDLVKLSLCLNIQVENPVLILNQDAARSFLKECDPKKFYQFFMKATQIETVIEKLNSCFATANTAKVQLENMKKVLNKYENDIEILKQKHSRLQSVRSLKKKINEYKNELEWLKVSEIEKELAELNSTLLAKQVEVKRITDMINNKEKYEKENREKIRELGTTFQELNNDSESNQARFDTAREEYERERDQLSEFENSNKSYQDKLVKQVIPNIRQLEQDINEHENNPLNVENMRMENEANIKEVQNKITENSAILNNSKTDLQMFMQTVEESKEKLEDVKKQLRKEEVNINAITNQIAQYKNAGRDTLSVYGQSTGRLLKELEQLTKQRKFTHMPKALLGRFIEVPDKKYRQAVETILRNVVTAFIVHCDDDRIMLQNVLKKYEEFRRANVITTQFSDRVHDVRRGQVILDSSPGVAMINVIKVKDPVVMNCLIDHCKVERIVFVEDINSAIQLTQDEHRVPQNLNRAVLLNPLSEYYPAPNYRSYSVRPQPLRYIQTNFTEIIRELENQKVSLEQKCEAIKGKYQEVVRKVQEFTRYADEKRRLMNELKQKERILMRDLEQLRDVEFPENTDIDFLRQQLEEEKRRKTLLEKRIEESREKLEQRRNIVERYKQAMEQQMNMARESRDKMRRVQLEIESIQNKLNKMKSEMETKGRQIIMLQEEEQATEKNVNELQKKVDSMIAKINGGRVPCMHTENELNYSIKSTELRIEGIQSSTERIEDVERHLNQKNDQFEKTKSMHKALDVVLNQVRNL